ncbi:MAG TPA: hypothetical protein VFZ64_13715 [Nocardioidaceae bacterium]
MEISAVVLGIVLMVIGIGLVTMAVFRSLGHTWTLGLYELWVIPTVGLGFILLGRWLVQ